MSVTPSDVLKRFYIKQGDTGPALVVTLKDATGAAVSLAGISAVRFHMSKLDGTTIVDQLATAAPDQTATKGKVTYDWQDGDTDLAGIFAAEFEVDFGGGLVETFPNDSDLQIVVTRQVG